MNMNFVSLVSIMFKVFSIMLVLSSNKIIMMWMGLEMNLYCTMPIFFKKKYFSAKVLIYLFFKVLGSLIFMFSVVLNLKEFFMVLSMFLKMSFFPFFFFTPFLVEKMAWVAMFVILVLKKIPGFYILKELGMVKKKVLFSMFLLVFFFSSVALYKTVKMKSLVGWSSVMQSSVLLLLLKDDLMSFFGYFLLYSSITCVMCYKGKKINKDSFMSSSISTNGAVILFMLAFTGIPPFFVFLYKVMFFVTMNQVLFWVSLVMLSLGFFMNFLAYLKILLSWVLQIEKNNSNYMYYSLSLGLGIQLLVLMSFLWLWL